MALPSPAPTAPPDPRVVAYRLQVRTATPTTCGWINANFASPVTCSEGYFCASNTVQNVHDCCIGLGQCFPPTTCLDSSAAVTACGNACLADLSTLKCTSSTNIHCYSLAWADGMSQFGCAASPFAQTVKTTYTGSGSLSGGIASPGTSYFGTSAQNSVPASTSTAAPTTSTSTGLSLSTTEIVGIAVGSLIFLIIFVIYPIKRYNRSRHPIPKAGVGPLDSPYPLHSYPNTGGLSPRPWHEPWSQPGPGTPPWHPIRPNYPPIDHTVVSGTTLVGDVGPDDSISVVGSIPRSPEVPRNQTLADAPPPPYTLSSRSLAPGSPSYAPSSMHTAQP